MFINRPGTTTTRLTERASDRSLDLAERKRCFTDGVVGCIPRDVDQTTELAIDLARQFHGLGFQQSLVGFGLRLLPYILAGEHVVALARDVWRERKQQRPADADMAEAKAAIERLAAAPADEGLVIREIWLLRLRALLARADGDAATYAQFWDRYRDMATSLGFEGHMRWAEAMP